MVSPAAIPIILASAIPIWKKRVGFSSMNFSIFREPIKSAQRATTLGLVRPSSASPAPKPLRVSFFPVSVYFFILLYINAIQEAKVQYLENINKNLFIEPDI